MTGGQLHGILHYLHRLTGPDRLGDGSDGQLLERFVRRHDEAAFTALVRRHGPLVWGVCRRLLHNTQDAEDSFQATFLVLARRAGAVGKRESVRSFLYGVAYRVAVRARGLALRRQAREEPLQDLAAPECPGLGLDLRPVLDEEIGRLPEKYRLPLILCHLEGRTQEEAARVIGCPRATVATRLARGKDRLRDQLTRRGLDVPASAFAATLHEAAAPLMPDAVVETTVRAAATGSTAPRISLLAEEVLRTMFVTRFKTAVVVLLALGAVGSGAGILASRSQVPAPADESRAEAHFLEAAEPVKEQAPATPVRAGDAPGRRPLEVPPRALEMVARLAQPIEFNGWDADDKMTLQEGLSFLADRYDLTFDVNEEAFRAAGVEDVLAEVIAKKPVPKMRNVRLEMILRKVLARLPAKAAATYVIRDDVIELTTEAAVRTQLGRHDRAPLLPLVYTVFDQRPLEEALREVTVRTDYTVVMDARLGDKGRVAVTAVLPNVPLDTAVRVLADMGGLRPVRLDNVFYVTTPENADRLRAEQEQEQPAPTEPGKDTTPKDTGKSSRTQRRS
jgi:RNA polymerase sigma factor (sigma-70 family)